MTVIMIILAVIGGATLSIQAAINGQLGSSVGVFKSAFLTFSVLRRAGDRHADLLF